MTEYALAWECMLKPRYYEMWLRREHDCTTFTQIWLYIKQHTVCPLLQIFPAEQWVDTHRHWCGASSGRLIRTPVDNTGVTAYGLWLISTRLLAAERSSYKAETQKHNIWTCRKVLCNKKGIANKWLHLSNLASMKVQLKCSCKWASSYVMLRKV